ncbi:MAG: hypothetical protein ACI8X5_002879, partial [Planctomycetota bacterium]
NGQTHPVISQNVFRLKGRRFEQLGQSWLKHGFCALCETGCGPRGFSGCASLLRVGCADTYSSSLNDGSGGGPKFTVDPTSGDHQHPDPTPSGNTTTRGRLQIAVDDVNPLLNAGATYFVEGMYVHWEDHQNGFAANNSTWRKVQFADNAQFTMQSASTVNHSTETAVYGWQAEDAGVVIRELENTNEAGAGVSSYYQVAYRIWDNGDGTWDYIYVVNNQNSTQGADSFSVPTGGANITDLWFNDVDYHSGEVQDGADWSMTEGGGNLTWDCPETFAQNPDANAINWCTAYSFGFTANAGPIGGVGSIDMFEPGVGSTLTFPVDGPGAGGGGFSSTFCFGDGISGTATLCPCFNFGNPGEGCQNSTLTGGASISGSGNPSISGDTLTLNATGAPTTTVGLFFGGTSQPGAGEGVVFGDGLLCAGGSITRLQVVSAAGGNATSSIAIAAKDGSAMGETRSYQYWYRDTSGDAPCGNGFNTTNGLAVTWGM